MATLDEAEALGVAPGALLFKLERVRMLDEVPIAIDRSIVPADLAPGLTDVDFRTESLYTALASAGLVLANAETTIEAREADSTIAEHLRVAVGKPILVMHQTVLNPADKPLFASTISYVGDRYRLRTSFARS
jgi:GntR family transcriptional regulator